MLRNANEFLARADVKIDSTDPLYFSVEAAFRARDTGILDPEDVADKAMTEMSKTSSAFDLGVAYGIALAISSEQRKCTCH